jgi:outer membrane protein
LLTSALNADMARVEMGVGAWTQDTEGTMSYSDNGATGKYRSAEKDYSQVYAWMLIKHPIPILPNLRLEYAKLEDEGSVTGEFKDFIVPGGLTTSLTYDIDQYDIIPYYNLLDNTAWITLDVGLDIKIVDVSYDVSPIAGIYEGYSDSETIPIPLLYVRTRVEIPATDIGIEADVKYVTYKESKVYDARVKVDYTLSFIPVIQPAIEVGYRIQKLDLDEDDFSDASVDMEYSGFYAGLMLRF